MQFTGGELERRTMQIVLIMIAIIVAICVIFIIVITQANSKQSVVNSNQRDLEIRKINLEFKKYEGENAGAKVKQLITEIMENNKKNEDYILYFNGKSKKSDLIKQRNEIISSVKYNIIISEYYGEGYIKEFTATVSK